MDLIMKQPHTINALPAWQATADSHKDAACIVGEWELVTVEIDGQDNHFVLGTVISDYKGRWATGDYVFTSKVKDLDFDTGLVRTRNSLYCLSGDGQEVFPSLEEAFKIRMTGQPLGVIRGIEKQGFNFVGR